MSQLYKNTASQKVRVFAFADAGHATLDAGEPVTGDAANITAVTAVDNGALGASNDVNPTEVDATNAPGVYEFDPTQAETNGDSIEWYPKSSTGGVQVVTIGGNVQTLLPPNFATLTIANNGVNLADNAITSGKYDESTAFPITAANGSQFTEAGGDGDHLTAINLPNQTMDITGSLSGSVGSVTGAVGSVTGNVGGNVTGSVGSISGVTFPANFSSLVIDSSGRVRLIGTVTGTVEAGGNTLSFPTDLAETTNNHYNDGCLVFTSGALYGQSRPIASYTGATGTITVSEALTEAPAENDTFEILPLHVHTTGVIYTQALSAIQAYDGPTNAEMEARTLTAANYATASAVASIQTDTTAIVADTNELQTDWTNGGRLDLLVDAILADTGTDGVVVSAASITSIWTTALTEAYRSTGATGTAAQLLYEIMAHLGEFAISSTTKTTKKLDGSTTAKTYTLDDATNPTSITEAT